jgi:hypothetical protein
MPIKQPFANPAGLGLMGLGTACLALGPVQAGWVSGEGVPFVIGWALFLGGVAQVIACILEFANKNIFGGTAFGTFGVLWLALGVVWIVETWGGLALAPEVLGWVSIAYLIFALYMTVGSAATNTALFVIFLLIDVLFLTLILHTFAGVSAMAPGIVNVILGFVALYGSAGTVLNDWFGRTMLPLGPALAKREEAIE